jgi:molybdenum cofactor guanylyltransferase
LPHSLLGVEGFVLAGGMSRRMGQDKAQLPLAGRTLLSRALDKLSALPLAVPPRVAGGEEAGGAVADLHPRCGPLSGIEAALAASKQPLNVFLPVDMPLLPAAFLQWMLDRAQLSGAPATVPRCLGIPQPLCAIYHKQLLEPIGRAMEAGQYKVLPVVTAADADMFDVEWVASTDARLRTFSRCPLHHWFDNCNTPEDLAAAKDVLVLMQ